MNDREDIKKFFLDSVCKDSIDIDQSTSSSSEDGFNLNIRLMTSLNVGGDFNTRTKKFKYEATNWGTNASKGPTYQINDIYKFLRQNGCTMADINKVKNSIKYNERTIIENNKNDSVINDKYEKLVKLSSSSGKITYGIKTDPNDDKEILKLITRNADFKKGHGFKFIIQGYRDEIIFSSYRLNDVINKLKSWGAGSRVINEWKRSLESFFKMPVR